MREGGCVGGVAGALLSVDWGRGKGVDLAKFG